MDDSKIWKWLSRITALWGVVIFIWSLLSYFNIAPFYEIRLIPKNSVEPYINVFSGQDIQLDFDKASYFRNAEIQKVKWEISGGKNSYSALGPRPIFKLPESYEGIYNLTLEVLLETNKKLYGKTSIYVVQQKTSFVRRTKTINFHIGEKMSSNALYFNSPKSAVQSIKKIEIYSGNNKWLDKEIIKNQDNSFSIKLNPEEQINTVDHKVVIRYQLPETKAYSYFSIPEK